MNVRQTSMSKTPTLRILAGVLTMSVALSGSLCAATIVSNDFTFGYGKNTVTSPSAWELQAPSSSTTQGLFTFAPSVSSTLFSSGGPLFTNRVLTTTPTSGYSGNSIQFVANLNFSYIGPVPVDAAPTPNFQINLIITSISIYGVKYNTTDLATLAFSETTVGHLATSSAITLNNVASGPANLNNATQFKQLAWNPDDFFVTGTNGTRSFALITEAGGQRPIDGFEVFGRIELTYDTIPEPTTVTLGLVGLSAVWFSRKRKRRV